MEWQFQAWESVGCWRCLVRWLHVPSSFKNCHQHSTALHLMGTNYAQGSVLRRTKTRNLWKMMLLIIVKFWYPPPPRPILGFSPSSLFVQIDLWKQPVRDSIFAWELIYSVLLSLSFLKYSLLSMRPCAKYTRCIISSYFHNNIWETHYHHYHFANEKTKLEDTKICMSLHDQYSRQNNGPLQLSTF